MSFGKFKMTEAYIARLLQNAEIVEIPTDEYIVEWINVDRQPMKDFIDQQKTKSIVKCILH